MSDEPLRAPTGMAGLTGPGGTGRAPRPAAEPGWAAGPLLGFDTETTGVDSRHDRLVTAALVRRGPAGADGARSEEARTWLADPGVPIPGAAAAVHGVTTERAQREGRPVVEVLEEVASELAAAMAAGVPVVAFNASYDLTLMEAELDRHGLPTLRHRLGRELGPLADPLVLDRHVDRFRRGKRRLDNLCAVYGVTARDDFHDAQVDVAATLDVLEAMVRVHPELARIGREELVSVQAGAHRRWAESFNAWLRTQNPGRTGAELDWPLPPGV